MWTHWHHWAIVLSEWGCSTTDNKNAAMKHQPYHKLIGELIWLSVVSWPNISFATMYLAHFNANPGKIHWHWAKCVLRYLKCTWNQCLTLGMNSGDQNKFIGYSDSDWGHNIDCCQSISGYVFQLRDSIISWKQQLTIGVSATKGKYIHVWIA